MARRAGLADNYFDTADDSVNESILAQETGIASRHVKVEAIADRLDTIANKLTSDDWTTLSRLIALIESKANGSETK